MADMQELISRLEAAETGSREFDRDIEIAIGGGWIGADEERVYRRDKNGFGYTQAFRTVTTSLDAALALAERALPDHMRGPISLCIAGSAEAYIDHVDPCGDSVKAFGKTPALALCICILWAIQHGYEAAGEVSPNLKAKAQGEGG